MIGVGCWGLTFVWTQIEEQESGERQTENLNALSILNFWSGVNETKRSHSSLAF
jgi:hypothetical protein